MKITVAVNVYEQDGEPVSAVSDPKLIIESHHTRNEMVIIRFPGSDQSVSVSASQLKSAIARCWCSGWR